jgi:methyl-accepting chemotaxis protein
VAACSAWDLNGTIWPSAPTLRRPLPHEDLLGLSKTFERWHATMDALLHHNADMHRKNEDFARIVRQMTIVTLNASIEAARAGKTGAGFAVVASEMRELAGNAQTLSSEYRTSLHQNDLLTTTTFQDLQATGKMIMGAVVGLSLVNRKAHDALEQAHEETPA